MKAIGGLVAGIAAGIVAMLLVGFLGARLFPIQEVDPRQSEAAIEVLREASVGAQVSILFSWFAAAFAGAAVAKWITRLSWPGWTIAGVLALLLAAAFALPLPMWMQTLGVLGPLIGGALADLLITSRPAGVEPEADVAA